MIFSTIIKFERLKCTSQNGAGGPKVVVGPTYFLLSAHTEENDNLKVGVGSLYCIGEFECLPLYWVGRPLVLKVL